MIKISEKQREEIIRHKELLIRRIETEECDIAYKNMNRIIGKIQDRFNIMLEEMFEVK